MEGSSSARVAVSTLFKDGSTAVAMVEDESLLVRLPLGIEDKACFMLPMMVDGSSSASIDMATLITGGTRAV